MPVDAETSSLLPLAAPPPPAPSPWFLRGLVVLSALGMDDFRVLAELLLSFSQLYADAGLLSPEGLSAMGAIIEWMQGYGN